MNKEPLISIITVVYNGERYLQQTIDSVYNQTYKNIEYIIVDGGSTDGTLDIIKQNKPKITKWISEPDKGLYDAMNKGIKMASGDLIGMINSDDWYELNAVELVVREFLKHPTKHIFHADRFDIIEGENKDKKRIKIFNPSALKFKYYGMTYNHPSMFITKKEYKRHLYNINLNSLADYQFVLEAYLRDKNSFHYINTPIVNYRLEGISAQIPIGKALKEGFISRQKAGLSPIENGFSFFMRGLIIGLFKMKNKLIKNRA